MHRSDRSWRTNRFGLPFVALWPFSISTSPLRSFDVAVLLLLALLIWLFNWTSSRLFFVCSAILFVDVKLLGTRRDMRLDQLRLRIPLGWAHLTLFISGLSLIVVFVSAIIGLLLLLTLLLFKLLLFAACDPFWYDFVDCITDVCTGLLDGRAVPFCEGKKSNRENEIQPSLPSLTSKSDPFTISTNCLHFRINHKFWLFSKSPGYDSCVCSMATPIRPLMTILRISESGKRWVNDRQWCPALVITLPCLHRRHIFG